MGATPATPWSRTLTSTIAANLCTARHRQRLSAQQVADRATQLGLPITRSAMAKLETGRRDHFTVAELIIFAEALGVAPLDLLFPPDGRMVIEYRPGEALTPQQCARRFAGAVNGAFLGEIRAQLGKLSELVKEATPAP